MTPRALSPKSANKEREEENSPGRPKTPRQMAAGLWSSAKDKFSKLSGSGGSSLPGSPGRQRTVSTLDSTSPRASIDGDLEVQQWVNRPKPSSVWRAVCARAHSC